MALTEREGGHACTGAGRRRTEEERTRLLQRSGAARRAVCSDGMETTDRPARRRRGQRGSSFLLLSYTSATTILSLFVGPWSWWAYPPARREKDTGWRAEE